MPIYTRVGDTGFTHLPRGAAQEPLSVPKSDARLAALGELDELNAHLGWCLSQARAVKHGGIINVLAPTQRDLFRIGASIASMAAGKDVPVHLEVTEISQLEKAIDNVFNSLPALTHFLLPGGCELAGRLHVARTVARRAERAVVVALGHMPGNGQLTEGSIAHDSIPGLILRYLNRLSDLLFALARQANHDENLPDVTWQP